MGKRAFNFRDLTGQKFSLLTVLTYDGKSIDGRTQWYCKCECGNTVSVQSKRLLSGHTKSCGCLRKEKFRLMITKHNLVKTPIYHIWQQMKKRCSNPNNPAYKNYGGRGIKVCNRWLEFENFYKDIGERPEGLTIERIDNNGNYKPGNCKWATRKEQCRNRRTNRMVSYMGKEKCLADWADILGINNRTLTSRLNRHSVEVAFNM